VITVEVQSDSPGPRTTSWAGNPT